MTQTCPTVAPVREGTRRVYAAQVIGATIDGFALTTAVLFFTESRGLAAGTVGLILGLGALAALVLAPFLGAASDRLGLTRAAVASTLLAAAALAGYTLATGALGYAAAALAFLVAQSWIAATRQALVAERVGPEGRVRARALMHTLLNAGMGLGAALGALALAADSPAWVVAGYGSGALLLLGSSLLFVRLPAAARAPRQATVRRLGALRDSPFMAVVGLALLLQLTMPILSVLLPLWVATRTGAPVWTGAAALALNTALVMAFQTRLARGADTDAGASRLALIAGVGLVAATGLIASAAGPGALVASLALLAGVLALTVGEMAAGAASWRAAFSLVPPGAEGEYQAVFGMASSGARIAGPAAALPLVLAAGPGGWLALGVLMGVAALALAGLLRRRALSAPARPSA